MSPEQATGLIVAVIVMMMGVLGSLIPVLPGIPLVFVAALVHRMIFGDAGASTPVLAVMGALMIFSMVLDALGTMVGARKLGATWRGMIGAMAGGVVGLFFIPFGLVLGPFIGAILGELTGGRGRDAAIKAGSGAVLGLLLGALGKVVCGVIMIILFLASVISRRESSTTSPTQFASVSRHFTPKTQHFAPMDGSRKAVELE